MRCALRAGVYVDQCMLVLEPAAAAAAAAAR